MMFGSTRNDGPSSNSSGLNNRLNSYKQGSGSYVPQGTTHVKQQTDVSKNMAGNILMLMQMQRHQLQGE